MDRKNMYAAITLIVVAILISSIIILTPNNPESEEKKTIVGKLVFPEDEGAHKEIDESWSMYMDGTGDDGKEYSITLVWNKYTLNTERGRSFQVFIARDGLQIYSQTYTNFRQTTDSNESLDIAWVSNMGGIMNFKRPVPDENMSGAEYTTEFINDESYVQIKMNSISSRNVVLMGMDGYADMGILGLLKGYIQPDMSVNGTLLLNNHKISISGAASYIHLWGYIPTDTISFSYTIMKNSEHTVFFFRTYLKNVNPAWEYLYVVSKDSYTVFITHYSTSAGNKTVGASVDNDYTVKDLEGESYDATIIDYFPEPANPSSHRCYPDHWFFKSYYDDYSLVCAPSDYSSTSMRLWEGFMTGQDNSNETMWGFEHVYTYFTSRMKLENLSFNEGNGEIGVTADINSSLPLNSVVLQYSFNISGTWTNDTVEMDAVNSAVWRSSVEIPEGSTGLRIWVHMQDKSYQWETSEAINHDL